MKMRLFSSVLAIMMALAAIGGATLAWFTAEAEIADNVFTAGTLTIEADESWEEGFSVENWNPGDCTEKEITVEVTGTKGLYLRAFITEEWSNTTDLGNGDKDTGPIHTRDIDNINWMIDDGLGTLVPWSNGEWQMLTVGGETYWYYTGGRLEPEDIVIFLSEVCLDGPLTGNEYQGATYTLGIRFEAIQTTNHAEKFEWDVAFIDIAGVVTGWFEVTNVGTPGDRWEDVGGNYYFDEGDDEWKEI